jgi:RHS repeat-associated protein
LAGTTLLNGHGTQAAPQLLEVMSRDLGNVPAGFTRNFGYGTLTLGSNTRVRLIDDYQNSQGTGPEALYLNSLLVPAGTTLDVNSLHVYARAAQINGTLVGGVVNPLPAGGPLTLGISAPGSITSDTQVDEWTFFGRAGQAVSLIVNTGSGGSPAPLQPYVNFANVRIVDPSGNVLTAATNSQSGVDVALLGVNLPADGTYRFQVRAGQTGSRGYYAITAWDGTIHTAPLNFEQTVTSQIDTPYRLERWTFSATAGQQVRFELINRSSTAIKFDLTGPGGYVGFQGLTTSSDLLTLPSSGGYVLTAYGTALQTGAYAFRVRQTTATPLTLGTASAPLPVAAGGWLLFQFTLSEGAPLRFAVNGPAGSQLDVYLKRGQSPTLAAYDLRGSAPAASQTVFTPFAAPGTWYAVVYANTMPTGGTVTAEADAVPVLIQSVTPSRSSTTTATTLTVSGGGFRPGTTVALVAAGGTAYPTTAQVVSSTQILATVAAGSVPAGTYAVRVTSADGTVSDQKPAALQLVAGGQAHLTTNLILPGVLGNHTAGTLYIEYGNDGAAPMPAPLLVLDVERGGYHDAIMTLDPALQGRGLLTPDIPDGFSSTIQLLASGSTPGLLQPGEKVRIPVYWSGWRYIDHNFPLWFQPYNFQLGVLDATTTTPIGWASIKDSLRPPTISPAAWDVLYPTISSSIGATWGNYIQALSSAATYLAGLGEKVTDIGQLWALFVQQANGLGPVSTLAAGVDAAADGPGVGLSFGRTFAASVVGRDLLGPLGRGWFTNWQTTLSVESDGTVDINGPAGVQRRFQPDVRGVLTPKYIAALDDQGILTKLTNGGYRIDELGGSATVFRPDGKLDFVADANGNKVTAGYDATGRLVTLTHSDGEALTIAYNAAGLIASVTDARGRGTTYGYDASNQYLTTVTAYDSRVTRYTYQTDTTSAARYALTSIAAPDGTHVNYEYDTSGRVSTISKDGRAERVTLAYGPGGQVTATDALNHTTTYDYDQRGLLIRTIDPLGRITSSTFDNQFNLTSVTDPRGQVATFQYDALGNVSSSTDVMGNTTQFQYTQDRFDRLARVTDANGNPMSYAYDAKGNLLSTTYADGSRESYAYDPIGNVIHSSNRRGAPIQYTYDTDGRLRTKTYVDGTTLTFGYDGRGNLTTATDSTGTTTLSYDANDRLTRISFPGGRFLMYTYDAAGRRTQMVDQDGFTTNYQYGALGRLAGLTDAGGASIVMYTYDAVGRLSREDKGNGTYTIYTYDAAGEVLSLVNYAPDGSVNSRFDYTYDDLGRRTKMVTVDGTWTYSYDATGQLTHAVFASTNLSIPSQDLQYYYDAVGNRTKTIENGVTTLYVTNTLNEYTQVGTATNQYDADGNLIRTTDGSSVITYTYNDENRLTGMASPAGTWAFTYDPFGNRISSTQNGIRTDYIIDPSGLGNVVGEYSAGAAVAKYVYGVGLTARQLIGGVWQHYDFDPLGSAAELTGAGGVVANRYEYAPFGSIIRAATTVSNDYTFLAYYGAISTAGSAFATRLRLYSPNIGRFTTVDPVGVLGQSENLYQYSFNNPDSFVDPTGNTPLLALVAAGGIGALTGIGSYVIFNPDNLTAGGFAGAGVSGAISGIGDLAIVAFPQAAPVTGAAINGVASAYGSIVEQWVNNGFDLNKVDWNQVSEDAFAGALAGALTTVLAPATKGLVGKGRPANKLLQKFLRYVNVSSKHPVQAQYIWYRNTISNVVNQLFNILKDVLRDPQLRIVQLVGSGDPNQLTGPTGFIAPQELLPYRIDFENAATATAPAQRVVITETLDPSLDPASVRFTGFGFGDTLVDVPPDTRDFSTVVLVTINGKTINVEIDAGVDVVSGRLYAAFQSIDPATELPPDVLTGFLPPEDGTGRGMGFFTYTVQPRPGLSTGTLIKNVARVVFDSNAPIDTNQVDENDPTRGTDPTKEAQVTIDAVPPTSSVTALPPTSPTIFTVRWSGTDDPGGSGIAFYDVYVSDNGGPFSAFLTHTTLTSALFPGVNGHTYGFYSIATDNVGNREAPKTAAEAMTTAVATGPVITWSSAGGGDWDDPANWDLHRLPTAADDVVINAPGATITHSACVADAVHSLSSNAALDLSAGSLTINAPSALNATLTVRGGGTLVLNHATLGGSGSLDNQGTVIVQGSSAIDLPFSAEAGSTLRVLGGPGGDATLTLTNGLTNNGLIELTSAGAAAATLTVAGGTLINATGGTINILPGSGGSRALNAILDNRGTLTVAQATTLAAASAAHSNSGTLNVIGGDLTVLQSGMGAFTNTGTLNVAAGRTLNLSGGVLGNFSNGTLSGGTYSLGGTLQFTGAHVVTNAATLVLDGAAARVIDESGNDALAGLAANAATGDLTVQNGRSLTTAGAFNNAGTLTVGFGGTFTVSGAYSQAGTAAVRAGGALALLGGGSAGGGLDDAGTLSLGAGTTFTVTGPYTQAGTLELPATATLVLAGAFANFAGGMLSGGTFHIGGTLQFAGANVLTNAATLVLDGAAAQLVDESHHDALAGLAANAGSLTVQNGRNLTPAGDFSNAGTLTVGPSSTFTVAGAFGNGGTLAVLAGGTFVAAGSFSNFAGTTLTGGSYSIAGTFQFVGANVVTNAATLVLDGTAAQVLDELGHDALAGLAANAGSLTVQNGRSLTTAGDFSNAGTLTVGAGSTFTVSGAFGNSGTLAVLAGGTFVAAGTFSNFAGTTLTGGSYFIAGTFQFTGANVVTNAATLVLDGTASQVIDELGHDALAGLAANPGSLTVQNGRSLTTAGDFSNAGALTVGANSTFTVSGAYSQAGTAAVRAFGVLALLGGGSSSGAIDNAGTLLLDGGTTFTQSGAYSQSGTLYVLGGSTLTLTGAFANFDGVGTLSGGTYWIAGTLQFTGASLQTNAATLVLDGPAAAIIDESGHDALAGFTTNNGSFTLQNGRTFSSSGTFSNAGALTVGAGSTFSASGTFNQTGTLSILAGGAVTLKDGTSSGAITNAGALTITANTAFTQNGTYSQSGTLTLQGALTLNGGGSSSGAINDAGTLTIGAGSTFTEDGAYTQSGALNVQGTLTRLLQVLTPVGSG